MEGGEEADGMERVRRVPREGEWRVSRGRMFCMRDNEAGTARDNGTVADIGWCPSSSP